MKLSARTLEILKNFERISPSILVRAGKQLGVLAPSQKVIAYADVEEYFDTDFAIYDLKKFLGALSLFKDPELDLTNRGAELSDGGRRLSYTFSAPDTVKAPPKSINFPSTDVAPVASFELDPRVLKDAQNAAAALGMPEMAIVGDGANIELRAVDVNNKTAHGYSEVVGETDLTFRMVFKAETFKFLPAVYKVDVSMKKIARFAADEVVYFVVGEDTSSVG